MIFQVLGVRCRSPDLAHECLRPGGSLASLHLVIMIMITIVKVQSIPGIQILGLLSLLRSLTFSIDWLDNDEYNHHRYAIGFAERSGPKAHIGWLAGLANATDQPYTANNTGGPSIKVNIMQRQLLKLGIVTGFLNYPFIRGSSKILLLSLAKLNLRCSEANDGDSNRISELLLIQLIL